MHACVDSHRGPCAQALSAASLLPETQMLGIGGQPCCYRHRCFVWGVRACDVVVRVHVVETARDAETCVSLLPCLVCLYAGNTFVRIKVSWKPTAGEGEMQSDEFDTVLLAIGRYAHHGRTHI